MPVTVRFVMFAVRPLMVFAKKLVDVALVEVTFVKTPVDGVVAPIVVPLIVPPEIVTFGETSPVALMVKAFSVVPDAVAKPSQEVEVTLVRLPFVAMRLVAKRLVDVTFVPVPFVKTRPWREVLPRTVSVEVTVELGIFHVQFWEEAFWLLAMEDQVVPLSEE